MNDLSLKERWQLLRDEEPGIRTRNAARRLDVSELELLCTELDSTVTHLVDDFRSLLLRMEETEHVMALTRNDHCVHEVKGHYTKVSFSDSSAHGLVLADNIDLRLFMNRWAYGVAVETPWKGGLRRSFQFFDSAGTAVHKIYMTNRTNLEAYQTLVDDFRAAEPPAMDLDPVAPPADIEPDESIDVAGFKEAWRNLRDTHDFFGMLRRFGVRRDQAMRLAPDEMVDPLDPAVVVDLLEEIRDSETPLMVFAGNWGCIQIFTGRINKLVETGPWYNILDPGFNLHLKTGAVDRAFRVRKPTDDGIVTSLELQDEMGQPIARFFGERKPGQAEDPN